MIVLNGQGSSSFIYRYNDLLLVRDSLTKLARKIRNRKLRLDDD